MHRRPQAFVVYKCKDKLEFVKVNVYKIQREAIISILIQLFSVKNLANMIKTSNRFENIK